MHRLDLGMVFHRRAFRAAVVFLTVASSAPMWAQQAASPYSSPSPYASPAASPAPALLSPDQLNDLVAPVALYPDSLLSQILAASTYPLEIVDAEQWLQQNRNLPAAQRMDTAKQQNWDPSVQALVAFPDVLDILGRDIRWTTDLGNAFLAQQADVMNAIQTMRARAQLAGKLQNTQQQTVTTQTQDGQSAIQIVPADPQYIYPPVYDPYAIWGPPVYGAYPSLWYPPAWGYGSYGVGIGFGPGYFIGGLFSGLLGFGGWGWGLSWFSHALFFNPLFFAHYGFHGYGGYGGGYAYHGALVAGHPVWAHDPVHRMGVPYANREVAGRFGGRVGGGAVSTAGRGFAGSASPGVRSQGEARSQGGARSQGNARSEAPRAAPRSEAGGAWRGVGSGGTRAPSANQFATRATPQAPARQSFAQGNRSAGSYNGGNYNRVGPSQSLGARPPSQSSAAPRAQQFNRSETPSRVQPQARQPQSTARSFAAPSAPRGFSGGGSSRGSGGGGGGAPHASAPRSSGGGGGGHSSGGHSGGRR